ncbi:hypothetical protein BU25DRAFT_440114 [Macroventuria anomochaeta]|uniref:Uncharacterized protein n=1 Tax=Macroventuria anomochaeta TaxID=301207 RepID=A0ACB6S025_9PLEO|nr:uncharacterized protein BU25DRAFT_440114 [Macroventuria anomochaeta]KAF2627317.1 hypothetical protein BU25DRAFT_440114 [Macroventuria anomochaeta]
MAPEKNTEKPKLSRKQLRGHGIEFIKKVSNIDELDSWLQPIGRAITRLQERFPKATRNTFNEELEQFYLHGQDRDDARREDWCLRPVDNFDYLQREDYTTSAAVGDHLKPESYQHALEDWARLNPKITRVSQPKPDLTYGFPVISPKDELFRTSEGDHQVESFFLTVLGELRNRKKESLISAPTTALHNWVANDKAKPLEAKDLMCFPWAVVEVKRGTAELVADDEHKDNKAKSRDHEKRAQFCYCQAANASAAGLTLREHLAARARDSSNLHNARVMFSFTCVGSAVKLWITYREKPNVKDWVYARVKPEISRWIHDVRQNRPQIFSLTPSGDTVIQKRRAASCEPYSETADLEKLVSPASRSRHRTPARPTLPHGKTAPGSLDRRLARASIPKIQLNRFTEQDGGEIDDTSDEGYASIHTRRQWESEEDEEENMSAFIYNDEPSEDDSDASYVPSSSEDESTEGESVEDEESSDNGASSGEDLSGQEENDDEYDLSDSERHCNRLNHQSRAFSRLEVYCTPTKAYKSSKPAESRSKRDRRRSSRF